jgi:tRNA (uracil-5-)-methyltransferase TRM9
MNALNDSDVCNVYDKIATQFDKTRYRCWSTVERVLDNFKKDSINIDCGCGNGKNMIYRNDIKFIGIDFCQKFIDICKSKELEVYKSDIRNILYSNNYFDNSISIAVIHHLDSREKRINAINEMFRITKNNGTIFIYVWAKKQPENSRFKFDKSDTLVPFKYNDNIFYRYYHLYEENELMNEVKSIKYNFELLESGYEMGNYYIYLKKLIET